MVQKQGGAKKLGSGKRINRQTGTVGTVQPVHKKPWRRDEKKARQANKKGSRKFLRDSQTWGLPNGQREKKADNRFPIISYAGSIVLLSTAMPMSHD